MRSLSVSEVKFFIESRGIDTRGFNIERPKEGELILGDVFLVGGWVVGNSSRAIEVNLLLSEVVVAVGLVDIDRPDVGRAFPAVEDAKSSGFRMEIPVVSLQGASELNLIAKLEDGTQVPLADIYLERHVDDGTEEEQGSKMEVGSLSDHGMISGKDALPIGNSVQPKSRKKTSARRKKSR
jgi:hypothetical protein